MINNGKATIDKSFNGLNIMIPSKKNWFALLFGTVWMGGWAFGFLSASGILMKSDMGQFGVNGFMTFWLLGWTAAGLFIVFFLLWGYFGRENFLMEGNEVLFEKTVFGIGKKNRFELSSVKNFRVELGADAAFGGNRWAFWGLGPGKIKFDYGFKTYSFGLGVDDAEANHIVGLLKEQFKEQ
ncbi:MAG: hypothetical protein V4651_13110 [Bacteroidota bacterium]